MKKVRVLVVEDSITVRKRLVEVLSEDPDIEVIAEAVDGKQAIDLCLQLQPDVISMDIMLPVMSGMAATEYIMAHCPTPILVVSSSFNRGEMYKSFEALSAGAVEVLDKAGVEEEDGAWEKRLISTIKLVSRIRVITHPRGRLSTEYASHSAPTISPVAVRLTAPVSPPSEVGPPSAPGQPLRVLAIGASTGGPAALVHVLNSLPADMVVPILVVVHISEPFATAFAEWLDGVSPRRVRYAVDGDRLEAVNGVLLAPPDRHLILGDNSRLRLTSDPERHSCRPSVDVLFESLARQCGSSAAACLLTGMGRDGATGLLEMRRAGGYTIAQDEASSIVYGMPREAALLGAAEKVLPLTQIGPALAAVVKNRSRA
jgi:two-component system chemotaxis response regulator CheB